MGEVNENDQGVVPELAQETLDGTTSSFGLPPAKRMRPNEQFTAIEEEDQAEQAAEKPAKEEEEEPKLILEENEEDDALYMEEIEGTDYKFYVSPQRS